MKPILLLVLVITACYSSFAAIKTVVNNTGVGWGNANNWSPTGVPVDGDEVRIPYGQTISIKNSFYAGTGNLVIKVEGNLDFDPSGKLDLGPLSQVQLMSANATITSAGTGSEVISIGGLNKFDGSVDGTITGPAYATNGTGVSPNGFAIGFLPVRFVSVSAKLNGARVSVVWQTAEEINTNKFEVERKMENGNWITISEVEAKGSFSRYKVEDLNSVRDKNYYRIKAVDADGRYMYSKQMVVTNRGKSSVIVVNPTTGVLNVVIKVSESEDYTLRLYNTVGVMIKDFGNAKGNLSAGFNISDVAKGMYYFEIKSGSILMSLNKILVY